MDAVIPKAIHIQQLNSLQYVILKYWFKMQHKAPKDWPVSKHEKMMELWLFQLKALQQLDFVTKFKELFFDLLNCGIGISPN